MKKQREHLYDYSGMINGLKKERGLRQREISEDIDCTEVHLSKVVNEKATLSTAKLIKFLNVYHLSMDDYVDESYRHNMESDEQLDDMMKELGDEEILLMVQFLKKLKQARKLNFDRQPDSKDVNQAVGKKIKILRRKHGYSEEDMADKLGIRPESYRNIESGMGTMMDNYVIIADLFEIPVSLLFSDFLKNTSSLMNYEMEQVWAESETEDMDETDRRFLNELKKLLKKYF